MNKSIKLLLLFLAIIISFSSCRKNEISFGNEIIPLDPEIIVVASISGLVTDENNEVISNVEVTIGSINTQTDENGYFSIQDTEINERGSFITTYKEGYFHNSTFVTSKLNSQNNINLVLIKKELSGSFNAIDGGTILLSDGAGVDFPSNGLVENNGSSYSGEVNVYVKWLDPTSPNLINIMPGDLRAIDQDEIQKQLTTFGMIGVEIEDQNGNQLNIKSGEKAIISLPIPQSILNDAPSEIPLWHFDESTGYWIEEGSAQLQGDKYVGEVGHFSFWNCDVPSSVIFLDGYIKQRGIGIVNTAVKITTSFGGVTNVGYTDDDGFFGGYVPIGETLNIAICNECGDEVYSEEIGPFEEDTTIPDIDIILDDSEFISFTGILIDCDTNPVQNGYVAIGTNTSAKTFSVDNNGEFFGTILACDFENVNIFGFDILNNMITGNQTIELDNSNIIDVGDLQACDVFVEYFDFFIDGSLFVINAPDPEATIALGILGVDALDSSDENNTCYFAIANYDGVGFYDMNLFGIQGVIGGELVNLKCGSCPGLVANISVAGTTGEFVVGIFEGVVTDDMNVDHQVAGEFSIKIQ